MMNLRNLLALFIVLAMLPIALSSFELVNKIDYRYQDISDDITMYKLRKIYLLSYEREFNSDEISFTYQNKEFELGMKNGKLILSPGTQIFLDEIDALYFEDSKGVIKINYERDNKKYEKILGKKEGLHFDDFLSNTDDDVELVDEFSLSDE